MHSCGLHRVCPCHSFLDVTRNGAIITYINNAPERQMAKFYVIETDSSGAIGCELTKKAAVERATEQGYSSDEFTVEVVEVEVTAESIRRLLGNLGGYAKQ
jgi:4-hydroxyphenylpyruvate dioxygenase-like putative hemolysin